MEAVQTALGGFRVVKVPAEQDPMVGIRKVVCYLNSQAAVADSEQDRARAQMYRSIALELSKEFAG